MNREQMPLPLCGSSRSRTNADSRTSCRILFTAVAHGTIALNDSLCETSDPGTPSENRHCLGPASIDIPVTDYSWRPCAPGDNCPSSGTGFNWQEQF